MIKCCLCFCWMLCTVLARAQDDTIPVNLYAGTTDSSRNAALELLNREDTTKASSLWPKVSAHLFFSNLYKNVLHPLKINQGKSTNFCGYAALTHLMLVDQPQVYVKAMLELYHKGETVVHGTSLKASQRIRDAAGTFRNKGELDIRHADQVWFLTLADEFKGYLNCLDSKYDPGNENTTWAATNFSKFNRMVRKVGGYGTKSAGSDFLRPWKSNFFDYIQSQLQKGTVMLYLNSKLMFPHRYTSVTLRAPTHFVVLYQLYKVGDLIEFKYWDYGMKTEQQITHKRLFKMIFGITTISHE